MSVRLACPRLLLLMAVCAGLWTTPTAAYLKFGLTLGGRSTVLRWPDAAPVPYVVGDRGAAGVSATEFREAIGRAFASSSPLTGSSAARSSTAPYLPDSCATMFVIVCKPYDRCM